MPSLFRIYSVYDQPAWSLCTAGPPETLDKLHHKLPDVLERLTRIFRPAVDYGFGAAGAAGV